MGNAVRRRYRHCITITRRVGGNDYGDRDCACDVRAYSLGSEDGDHLPANVRWGKLALPVTAAGQVYELTGELVYLGGAISANRDLSVVVTRQIPRVWVCFGWYKVEIYDRPGVSLRPKVRLLKAEVLDTLLYGCATWNPNPADYDRLRKVHHKMLLRCSGWRKRKREDQTLSYAHAPC